MSLVETFTNTETMYHGCYALADKWTGDKLPHGPGYDERTLRLAMIHWFRLAYEKLESERWLEYYERRENRNAS